MADDMIEELRADRDRWRSRAGELAVVLREAQREISRYIMNDEAAAGGGAGCYNDPHEVTRITRRNIKAALARFDAGGE